MGSDFLKSQIRLLLEKFPHLAAVRVEDDRLASTAVMKRSNVAELAALLEKFFHHAQRYLETAGDILTCDIAPIIGIEKSLAEIHGKRCHEPSLNIPCRMAMLLFKML